MEVAHSELFVGPLAWRSFDDVLISDENFKRKSINLGIILIKFNFFFFLPDDIKLNAQIST